MDKSASVFVAGSDKPLGKAIVKELKKNNYKNILALSCTQPDLINTAAVYAWFAEHKPEYVILAAGKSGGIAANKAYPADFIYNNILIQTNVIDAAKQHAVKKLLFLASSCVYPKFCKQPMPESEIMTGPLEPTNEAYAMAKLSGLAMCKAYHAQYGVNFISAIPTNYFSEDDDFSPENSHVIGALISKIHFAKLHKLNKVNIFGTGSPRREFLNVEDIARATVFLLERYNGAEPINIGGGCDITIKELACMIKDIIGYDGELFFDTSKQDGMPVKILDASKIFNLGWRPIVDFKQALQATYQKFLELKVTAYEL